MDYVPTKAEFPVLRTVRKDLQNKIPFPLNGRAPKGFWTRKLDFLIEVIHEHPPTVVKKVSAADRPHLPRCMLHVMRDTTPIGRRAFNFTDLETQDGFPVPVLWGDDVVVSVLAGQTNAQNRFRHAQAHTLCFVHSGKGTINTDFGTLTYTTGDLIVLPRQTTYAFTGSGPVCLLLYECIGGRIMRPHHHHNRVYPFVPSSLVPSQPKKISDPPASDNTWPVYVKRHTGVWTLLQYPFSPFDAVAWEGELYPFILHMEDIRTLTSPDYHVDPTLFTVFITEDESASFQVFRPSWKHSLPYNHKNYVTEVLFNHRGYTARPEIKDGFATVHPPGIFHGPDIQALWQQNQQKFSKKTLPWDDGIATMLEVRSPLVVLPDATKVEVPNYESSWYEQYQELEQQKSNKSDKTREK
ncbi:homogentisate 1,2-dioxygenase [Patescibacteria group bacterium AH-259-L05]|nr:homogentisate 1,2-dioxygenase [Patescibacteria group bacterium AH-259-L05]